ncbi:hypothetical protein V6N13_024948 [Hibiscus sabdariffa]
MVVITPQIQVKLLVEVLVQGQFNALLWALLGSMSCLKKSIMSNLVTHGSIHDQGCSSSLIQEDGQTDVSFEQHDACPIT